MICTHIYIHTICTVPCVLKASASFIELLDGTTVAGISFYRERGREGGREGGRERCGLMAGPTMY